VVKLHVEGANVTDFIIHVVFDISVIVLLGAHELELVCAVIRTCCTCVDNLKLKRLH